jgi:serralysin
VKRRLLLALLLPALLWATPADAAVPLCWGKKPTKVGTAGNDVIYGTDGADVIAGLGGNDIIKGRRGADRVCGNEDNDLVYGDKGDDLVGGDLEDDALFGGVGNDKLNGGGGENDFDGGLGNDLMTAASTYDFLIYLNSATPVNVNFQLGRATGQGTDTIRNFRSVRGSQFADTLTSAPGAFYEDTYLSGEGGKDRIDSNGAASSILLGGDGDDTVLGRSGIDSLRGEGGDD